MKSMVIPGDKSVPKLSYRAYHPGYAKTFPIININLLKKEIEIEKEYYKMNTVFKYEDVAIMQSYGLTDKKGVEVFEKDVIQFTLVGESEPKRWCLEDDDIIREDKLHSHDKTYLFKSGFEVIGNAYEDISLVLIRNNWIKDKEVRI